MRLEQFAMERLQSTWENRVEYNLSESGVRPLTVGELAGADAEALLAEPLVYTQANGTEALRTTIAGLYPGANHRHVLVTTGGAEANFVSLFGLVEPGDEVALLVPTYMQAAGLTRAFGGRVREWPLIDDRQAGRWRPDLDALRAVVSPATKLIAICTPNNPTGARLTAAELDEIAAIADTHGAWILSDEIFRGAEVDDMEAASMWGRSERVIVTSGLSKAYGLPGLRVGWIAAPQARIEALWAYHDYTTIAPSALSDRLARIALSPVRRAALLARTRGIIRDNLPVVETWLAEHDGFSWLRPEAGAILYVRYPHPIDSTELATRLRDEQSVLVVPGDHFGMGHCSAETVERPGNGFPPTSRYIRIGVGESPEYITRGLARLDALLRSLPDRATAAASRP